MSRIEPALLQHADADLDGIADGFDAPQGKRGGRVEFEGDRLGRQGSAFFQREAVGIAAQGLARVFGGGCGHG